MFNDVLGRLRNLSWLFILTVVAPTILSIFYFGLIASDVYVSEARFVVRSPEKQSGGALGLVLKSAGFANAGEEVYAVQDFALSRDALHALNKNNAIVNAFSSPQVDFINRFGYLSFDDSFEELYRYYQKMVRAQQNTTSSITTLTVRAYTAEDAYRFNEHILSLSEALVNKLNQRAQRDLIGFAQNEVGVAEERAREAAVQLAVYRNQEAVVDPEKQAQVQFQLVSKLQDELISTRSMLAQMRKVAPENPQIDVLQARASSLESDIKRETANVAGGNRSLAGKASRYQRLWLESQFADRQLASAMASLEEARNEAQRKQIYLERIVQPNKPDIAMEPRRIRGILATFVLGLVACGILSMLLAGLREHQD